LLGPNASSAYSFLSKAGKLDVPDEQVLEQAAAAIQQVKPEKLAVQHTYLINLVGMSPGRVVCATDLTKPDGWVSVVAGDFPEQAYVLLSAHTVNNQLVFTVWLVPEAGTWKVQSFSMHVATLAEEGSEQLWQKARTQKLEGHDLNAALLYATAAETANRGPNLQLGLASAIGNDMSQLSIPAEIRGQPPFQWKTPDGSFKVLVIGPIAVGGKVYLMIRDESPPWTNDSQIDARNRKLIAFVKRRFPEYSDSFAGIVVQAHEEGTHRVYGTVEVVSRRTQ
jgi:hypothetical protein